MVQEENEFENCHMKYSLSTLSLSVSKEIIENDNSWVLISLSKVGENEFVQTL